MKKKCASCPDRIRSKKTKICRFRGWFWKRVAKNEKNWLLITERTSREGKVEYIYEVSKELMPLYWPLDFPPNPEEVSHERFNFLFSPALSPHSCCYGSAHTTTHTVLDKSLATCDGFIFWSLKVHLAEADSPLTFVLSSVSEDNLFSFLCDPTAEKAQERQWMDFNREASLAFKCAFNPLPLFPHSYLPLHLIYPPPPSFPLKWAVKCQNYISHLVFSSSLNDMWPISGPVDQPQHWEIRTTCLILWLPFHQNSSDPVGCGRRTFGDVPWCWQQIFWL